MVKVMFLFNGDWTIRSNSTWSKKNNDLLWWRTTAVDVASSYPLVVEALQAARLAANARASAEVDVMATPDAP